MDLAPWQCEAKLSNSFFLSWKHFLKFMFSQEFPFILILRALVTNTNTWCCASLDGEVYSILTRHDLFQSHLVLPVTHGVQEVGKTIAEHGSSLPSSSALPIMVIHPFT